MTYATGIYDDASPATPKNFVVLYDENENPISTALVQVNGSVLQTPGFDHQTPAYYANFENNNGAFATMIPNNLSGGIKGIAEFTADGMLVNTWQDEDGIWAGYSTSDCGYGMNPPSSNSTEIQFQLPQISLLSPSYGMEVCNYPDDQLPVVFNARGIATINLWASINGGAYELIENNIDARNGYYLWDVPRGRFADANIQLWLEVPEYPEKSYESGIFRIYDSPVVTNQTPSMNYCVNTDVVLTTEAEGSLLTYQWYKDGKLLVDGANISGSRQAVLTIKNIRHNDAGVYKAYVYGHNNCPSARTESIAVYPARPISFVLPKNDITIGEVLGNIALLNFRVHVNGVEIESADFERYDVKVEWFRKVTETNSIKLVDNDRISGTLSDWLTIRNFQDSDQGVYFAVVTGLCGDATVSPLFTLVKVDITIDQQPQSQNLCLGNQLSLHGSASSSADEIITYQWYKNSSPLMNDVKISGVDTETLTINDISASDMGSYYLSATLSVSGQSINSDIAELTVDKFANIILQPDSVKTIVAGTQLSLEVMAEGNDSNEELLYQWYFNNVAIPDENLSILILDDAQAENSGEYYCVITNKCGALKSATSTVTVTPKQATDVSETFNSSFGLGVVNPNPAIDVARFTVSSAKTEVVSVKLIDELGNEISTIVNQVLSQGVYNYQIDITNLGLSNGTYFLLLQSIEGNLIQKFIVVR